MIKYNNNFPTYSEKELIIKEEDLVTLCEKWKKILRVDMQCRISKDDLGDNNLFGESYISPRQNEIFIVFNEKCDNFADLGGTVKMNNLHTLVHELFHEKFVFLQIRKRKWTQFQANKIELIINILANVVIYLDLNMFKRKVTKTTLVKFWVSLFKLNNFDFLIYDGKDNDMDVIKTYNLVKSNIDQKNFEYNLIQHLITLLIKTNLDTDQFTNNENKKINNLISELTEIFSNLKCEHTMWKVADLCKVINKIGEMSFN